MRKRIKMIATGGTIASEATESGLTPKLSAASLLECVPELENICEIEVTQPFEEDSTNIALKEWKILTGIIEESYADFDGFVISHGTDTMAYTAAALSYMIQKSRKPIVLTGSQLPIRAPETDAIRNIKDAFLCASEEQASGVCVVFDGKVIDGRSAKKIKTKSFDAFASINRPELGQIKNGQVFWTGKEKETKQIKQVKRIKQTKQADDRPVFFYNMEPDVCVLKLTPGFPERIFSQVLGETKGVILEGFGTGGIPAYLRKSFYHNMQVRAEKGWLTMMETQVLLEGTDMDRYEVGKEVRNKTGILECKEKTVEEAVAEMMWLLGKHEKREI